MTPLLGFAPDVDVTTPGIITDCTNFIPYENGMEGGPAAATPSTVPVLAAECLGAAVVTDLSGVRRIIAGTATKLYELAGGAWDDVSRVAAYNATPDARWSITQFGNTTLAADKGDVMQRSTGVGVDFADIAGAPKADIIFSVGAQVMALNCNDGTDKPDGWHVCATNDETSWAESLTTQAASGRLVSTPGVLTAGARLGEFAVAYKAKSIYLGRYVGTPTIWDWTQVAGGEIGCVGKEAICDIGGVHFFVGDDGIWLFDGTRPVPVDGDLHQWFNDHCNPSFRYRCKVVLDRAKSRVWLFFPSNSSTTCDSALVYHVKTRRWGRSNRSIEACLNYIESGLTYDTWSTAGATYDSLPNVSYDSAFWLAGAQSLGAFNTSHRLQTLSAASDSSGFTTGDIGDDAQYSLLTGIRLRYAPGYAPTSATAQTYHKANSGDDYTAGASGGLADGKFDVMAEDRWHSATFLFTGPVRVTAGQPKIQPSGEVE